MCAVGLEKLTRLAKVDYGFPFESSLFTDNSVYMPLIRIRDIKPAKASTYYEGEYSDRYVVRKGDILVGMDGEFNLERWNDRDGLLNQRILRIKAIDGLSNESYLYHLLAPLFKNIEKKVQGGSVKHLSAKIIENLYIPYVDFEEQVLIGKQLDTFTTLISNLESELDMRRKQYEHYRNQLLDFEGVEELSLSEIFEMRGGYTPSTKNEEFWEDGILPWFRMEDIRENGNILSDSTLHITPKAVKKNGLFPMNSIILATSATIGVHALLTVPALSNQRFTAFYPKEKFEDKVNYKYTYYVFYIIDEWCKNNTVQGGFASVDMAGLRKYLFPLPSLAKQQEIVEKLDAFENLIQSLEQEIKLRKQQYEYYREKLLTF